MAKSWQELKKKLEEETRKISLTCPDEIKRFHYGIITHSEAGKYSLNQYFGHFVHLYSFYYCYSDLILRSLLRLATDPEFNLAQLKKVFYQSAPIGLMAEYGGQKTLATYAEEMVRALDTLETKDEFIELMRVWNAFASRLYWWVHWYFPWGAGPAICPRLSPDDIKEIARLSQSS